MPDNDKITPICGLVMPISAIDNYPEKHWAEVRAILSASIEDAGFEPNMVSNADDVGIIQKRIIHNLYDNPIVVCDVSGKNPNVMFELGLRLAFDKPTVIVKDDATTYSFDTAPIEHLPYPRDLRYGQIVDFKRSLSEKIRATHDRATADPEYTTFLKNFGEFTVAKIDKKEVTGQEYIIQELKLLQQSMQQVMANVTALNQRELASVLSDFNPYTDSWSAKWIKDRSRPDTSVLIRDLLAKQLQESDKRLMDDPGKQVQKTDAKRAADDDKPASGE